MREQVETRVSSRFARVLVHEWGTIAFTLAAVGFLVGAFGLRGQAGQFPMAVAGLTVILGFANLALALSGRLGASDALRAGSSELGWNRRTVLSFVWFGFALALTYIFGLVVGAVIASPIYFLLLTSLGVFYSLLNGISIALFIWVVFSKIAGLPLYDGLF